MDRCRAYLRLVGIHETKYDFSPKDPERLASTVGLTLRSVSSRDLYTKEEGRSPRLHSIECVWTTARGNGREVSLPFCCVHSGFPYDPANVTSLGVRCPLGFILREVTHPSSGLLRALPRLALLRNRCWNPGHSQLWSQVSEPFRVLQATYSSFKHLISPIWLLLARRPPWMWPRTPPGLESAQTTPCQVPLPCGGVSHLLASRLPSLHHPGPS